MNDTNQDTNLGDREVSVPDVKSIDEIPGSIFDPTVVRATGQRQLQEMEDRHNFSRRFNFLRAVANWQRNRKGQVPQPPLKLTYLWVENTEDTGFGISNDPEITEGPELVANPYVPPVNMRLSIGIVAFGYPIGDGSDGYYAGPTNTVQPGTHAVKDGTEYVFVVLGRIGTVIYRKMWIPVGN